MHNQTAVHKERRSKVLDEVRKRAEQGLIILFGGFEQSRMRFRQESSFYYLTGIEEPGAVLTLDIASGKTTLYKFFDAR